MDIIRFLILDNLPDLRFQTLRTTVPLPARDHSRNQAKVMFIAAGCIATQYPLLDRLWY